jgi:hypothetical protein
MKWRSDNGPLIAARQSEWGDVSITLFKFGSGGVRFEPTISSVNGYSPMQLSLDVSDYRICENHLSAKRAHQELGGAIALGVK